MVVSRSRIRRGPVHPNHPGSTRDAAVLPVQRPVVLQLLREVGYEALTLQAVAGRGRCSTVTLYRQWQGKPKLVVAALQPQRIQPVPAELDAHTGSLREALREMVRRVSRAAPPEHQLVAGLSHASLGDPELATAMREQCIKPAAEILKRIVDRAAARGEISPDNPAREFATSCWSRSA
ncbi:TetR/AcrR family transcriptional regulator C-terminal ligand-binding domain-containing protein [Streptomyces sp. NPDC001537]